MIFLFTTLLNISLSYWDLCKKILWRLQNKIKILTTNEIITSQEYEGFIDFNQFDLSSIKFPENKYFINLSVEEERKRVLGIERNKKGGH